jgi:hypothetical protein
MAEDFQCYHDWRGHWYQRDLKWLQWQAALCVYSLFFLFASLSSIGIWHELQEVRASWCSSVPLVIVWSLKCNCALIPGPILLTVSLFLWQIFCCWKYGELLTMPAGSLETWAVFSFVFLEVWSLLRCPSHHLFYL